MKETIIKIIDRMIIKEKNHFKWLSDNKACQEMIKNSQNYLENLILYKNTYL